MKLAEALQQAWYRENSWSLGLLPLSWLFRSVVAVRRLRQQRLTRNPPLPVPVVVVGNIAVGGTGKTPVLAALVKYFQSLGYRPGVISRGYGGKATEYPLLVAADSRPDQVGDEPLLLAQHCPVAVSPDRYAAARHLLAHSDCNLLFSDDGLQHYRLPRDIELVVVDGERGFGNRQCLPAGPLREPLRRLQEVDFVLVNDTVSGLALPGSDAFQLMPTGLRNLDSGAVVSPEQWPHEHRVHAVAGIGNPGRFAHTLSTLGFEPVLHPLPDHHEYRGDELCFADDLPVIITAKDAVKCARFAADNVWVLDVEATFSSDFLQRLERRIDNLRKGV